MTPLGNDETNKTGAKSANDRAIGRHNHYHADRPMEQGRSTVPQAGGGRGFIDPWRCQ
jgi:hypothetical protein